MPRPRNTIRPVEIRLSLPETVRAQMDVELFSELEGRVPYGARTQFVQQLVQDYFRRKAEAAAVAGVPPFPPLQDPNHG